MSAMRSHLEKFYTTYIPEGELHDSTLIGECPFCTLKGRHKPGKISVVLNRSSFFYGYFRCSVSCVAGGYDQWFARLAGVERPQPPSGNEDEPIWKSLSYPQKNINQDIDGFEEKLAQENLDFFHDARVGSGVLQQLKIGYNGRYLVYPYIQPDGNAYSARCVHPESAEDYFWYGDESFGPGSLKLFNLEEIERCAGGALFLCEGEENLLTLKQLGFPGVAYFEREDIERLSPELFSSIKTLFIVPRNSLESYESARVAASNIGFKVRILRWDLTVPKGYSLHRMALESGKDFAAKVTTMIVAAKPFSPFPTPDQECQSFFLTLGDLAADEYRALNSGFPLLDQRLGGIHGINILGGGPKVGKSNFMIQIATTMAANSIPVLYYDFENGRQRIYQRTCSRLSRVAIDELQGDNEGKMLEQQMKKFRNEFSYLLRYFRVVNDRKLTPEIMRRHIDFLRHETGSQYTVVVIDSLHKLPFKDISEMRSGIDAWLRQLEAIRDELDVAFLVVSELSRGAGGRYEEQPHMGIFKGSGDIEYSADNAMVLLPRWDHMQEEMQERINALWLVGSREHSPGLIGNYRLDYPYWGFTESPPKQN